MIYNTDFLIAAMMILLLILWYFIGQKKAEDLNSRVFLIFLILVSLDVAAEWISNYYITSAGNFGMGAVASTTLFYLFLAMRPYVMLC